MIVAKTRGRFASQSVQGKASHEYAQSGRRQRDSAQFSNKKRLVDPQQGPQSSGLCPHASLRRLVSLGTNKNMRLQFLFAFGLDRAVSKLLSSLVLCL